MASFEILPYDRGSSDSFPAGEYSLLHEVKKEPCLNAHSNNVNFDFTNMQSTMNKLASDENSIFLKLFSTNLSMKESLNETNSRLKKLLDNSSGLASVIKQQQPSKKVFEEKISFLEKENANLRCKLNFLVDGMSKESPTELYPSIGTDEDSGYEIVYIKASELELLKKEDEDLTETSKVNVLKMRDLENKLKAQIELMTAKLKDESTVTEQHRKRCESLQQKYDEYVKTKSSEENDIKQELQNLQEILKKEREDNQVTRDALAAAELKLKKTEEDFDASSKLFEIRFRDEKAKLELLKKENEDLTEASKVNVLKMRELENELKAQMELVTAKLKDESTVTEQHRKRCESHQQQYDEYVKTKSSQENDVKQKSQDFQEILKKEREDNQVTRDALAAAELELEKTEEDFDASSKLFEIRSRDEKAKIHEPQYHHAPKPFKFGYDIKDKHGEQYRQEEGNSGQAVKESYEFTDVRGVKRQVEYVADHAEFRAQVKTNEPGTASQNPAAVLSVSNAPYVRGQTFALGGLGYGLGNGLGYGNLGYNTIGKRLGNAGYGLGDGILGGLGYDRYGY